MYLMAEEYVSFLHMFTYASLAPTIYHGITKCCRNQSNNYNWHTQGATIAQHVCSLGQ